MINKRKTEQQKTSLQIHWKEQQQPFAIQSRQFSRKTIYFIFYEKIFLIEKEERKQNFLKFYTKRKQAF